MANKGGFIGQDGLNAPDEPTGVNAHTAFDTQATVSFTAPSDVGGSAITGYQVQSNNGDGSTQSIGNASYDNVSFSTSTQITVGSNYDVAFSDDGTKMYANAFSMNTVFQYTLSTAWDISTASYASKSFAFNGTVTSVFAMEFSSDGTKLYLLGQDVDIIYQFTLSSAWDISTASYASKSYTVSQDNSNEALKFKSDGTKVYTGGSATDTIYQHSLSTAWDISTGSYDSVSFSAGSQDGTVRSVDFDSSGTKMFICGGLTDTIYQYTLSTAWDLSTASYDGINFSLASQETNPYGFCLGKYDDKLYLSGTTANVIYQYTTNLNAYPTASPVTITGLTNGTSYTFNVWAINAFGWSSSSDASASVTPQASRGVFGNSQETVRATMDLIIIPTTGNATDFGDMTTTAARGGTGSTSSTTRGLFMGGDNVNIIDYITIATEGNAIDFGDFTTVKQYGPGSFSNSTRAIAGGGSNNTLEYVTIATTGNATDFGDDYLNYVFDVAGAANSTRGLLAGGFYSATNNSTNTIRYVTIATTGNTTDFGDLTVSRGGLGGASNATRGMFFGGGSGTNVGTPQNTVDYVTIASTGNAVDFGDLSATARGLKSVASQIRAVTHLGNSGGNTNILEFFTIASIGNAVDFGDLINASSYIRGACSNSHGGLS